MKALIIQQVIFGLIFSFKIGFAQESWQAIGPSNIPISSIVAKENYLFVSTFCDLGGVFLSENGGNDWVMVNNGLPPWTIDIKALLINGSNFYAGLDENSEIYESRDLGQNWKHYNTEEQFSTYSFASITDTTSIAGTTKGAKIGYYFTLTNETVWFPFGPDTNTHVLSIVTKNSSGFLGKAYLGTSEGIYRCDSPNSCVPVNIGIPNGTLIFSMAANGSYLLAGTGDNGVFASDNNGNSWRQINVGLETENNSFNSFAFYETTIFVAASGILGGVYYSTNGGENWHELNSGLPSGTDVYSLAISGTFIYAGTSDNGVFKLDISGITNTEGSTIVGLDEISISPNPNKGIFTISNPFKYLGKINIGCMNNLGQSNFSKSYFLDHDKPDIEIDMSNISNGIYYLYIQTVNDIICRRIIVNK